MIQNNISLDVNGGVINSRLVFTPLTIDSNSINVQVEIFNKADATGLNPVQYEFSAYDIEEDSYYRIKTYTSPSPTLSETLVQTLNLSVFLNSNGNAILQTIASRTVYDELEGAWLGTTGKSFELTFNKSSFTTEYTLSYDFNGGVKDPYITEQHHNGQVVVTAQIPERNGYRFINWNTQSDGTGTSYFPSSTVEIKQNLTLYAIWELYSEIQDGNLPTLNIFSVNELDSLNDNIKAFVELNGELAKLPVTKITNENSSAEIQTLKNELKEINDEISAMNDRITTINDSNTQNINFLAKNNNYTADGSGTGWSASKEVAIGVWIDGKTIYKKAWQLTVDAQKKEYNIGFDRTNVDVALRMDVMCICDQGLTPLYADTSHTVAGEDYFRAYFGSETNRPGHLMIRGGSSSPSTPYTAIVILEYTKK